MTRLLTALKPIHAIMILATILICYGNSLQNGFVWDDHLIIVENRLLSNAASLPALLLSEDSFPGITTGYYRPLTYLSFFADRMIWGTNPMGFTLTNIILHLLVSFVLYLFIKQAFSSDRAALFASLLFAAHPVASEAINFHSGGRNTLLCAFFVLASLAAHSHGSRALTALFAALAMLSKEFGLILPVLLIVHDKIVVQKSLAFREYLPTAAVAAIYLIIRSTIVTSNLAGDLQILTFLASSPEVIVTYLKNFIVPISLKTIYSIDTTFRTATVGHAALLLGTAAILYRYRQHKMVLFGALTALLLLLPVLNIVPIGVSLMADRHAYLPLIGFTMVAGSLLEKLDNRISAAIMIALLLFYGTTVISRNGIWKNDYSLYTRMITDAPEKGIGYQNLGLYHYNNGDSPSALQHLSKCYALGDNNAESLFALAAIHYENGNHTEALPVLNRLVVLYPETPQAYLLLSRISQARGDLKAGSVYMAKARQIIPGFESMLAGQAGQLTREAEQFLAVRQTGKAEHKIKTALILAPDFIPAHINLGIIQAEKGDTKKALDIFNDVMKRDPANPTPHFNAHEIYRALGKKAEAEREMIIFRSLSNQQNNKIPTPYEMSTP